MTFALSQVRGRAGVSIWFLLFFLWAAGNRVEGSQWVTRDQSQLGLSGSPELGGLHVLTRSLVHWWHVGGTAAGGEGGGVEGTVGYAYSRDGEGSAPRYFGRGLDLGGACFDEVALYHTTQKGLAYRAYGRSEHVESMPVGSDFSQRPGRFAGGATAIWRGEVYYAMTSDELILDLVPRGRVLVHSVPIVRYPQAPASSSRLVADGSDDLGTQYGVMKKMGFLTQPVVGGGEVSFGVMLAWNGDLLRFLPEPIPGVGIAVSRVASGVTDFAIRKERVRVNGSVIGVEKDVLYVVYREGNGLRSRLVTRDLVTDVERQVYGAGSDRVRLTSVALDSMRVFVAERDLECRSFFGNLWCEEKEGRVRSKTRGDGFRFLTGEEPDANWAVVDEGVALNLISDGQRVWLSRGADIRNFRSDAPPIRVNVKPLAMEVVQTVQDLNNSVPLVASKATYVRGYAVVNENTSDKAGWFMTGQLEVKWGAEFLGRVNPVRSGYADGQTNLYVLRNSTTRDFLFEVPREWMRAGVMTFTFVVNPGGGLPEQGGDVALDNHRTATVQVLQSTPLELQVQPVEALLTSNYNPLTDAEFPPKVARALSMMPVPELWTSFKPELVDGPYDAADEDEWSDALSDLNSGIMFELLVDRSVPRHRVGIFGYRSPRPAEGPTLAGLGYRPGRSLLMRIDDDPGARLFNAPDSGTTLAHELGHNLGLKHVNNGFTTIPLVPSACAGFTPKGPFEPYPYDGCSFGYPSLVAASNLWNRFDLPYGFDVMNRRPVNPWEGGDVMSYMGVTWTSPYSWRRMLQGIPSAQPASPFAMAIRAGSRVAPAGDEVLGGDVFWLRGKKRPGAEGVEVVDWRMLQGGVVNPEQIQSSLTKMTESGSEWRVRLLGGGGVVLAEYPLVLELPDEGNSLVERFDQVMPVGGDVVKVEIVKPGGQVVESRQASVHAPVVVWGSVPREVGGRLEAMVELSDQDGDPVSGVLLYSADDGATWATLQNGFGGGRLDLATRWLSGGEVCRLRVVVSDGFRTTVSESGSFAVERHGPEIHPAGVVEGMEYPYGTELHLSAVGFDAEDGGRPDAAFSWEVVGSTIRVANSAFFHPKELAPGSYLARATLYDSEGNAAAKSYHFEIGPALIPEGGTGLEPVVDGELSEEAYGGAVSFPLAPEDSVRVRMFHVSPYVYVGVTGLRKRGEEQPARFRLGVNVEGRGDSFLTGQDVQWWVDERGGVRVERGNGSEWELDLEREGSVKAAVARGGETWCAEMRLHEDALGGWGRMVKMRLDHDYLAVGAPLAITYWPPDMGAWDIPSIWPLVALGETALPGKVILSVSRETDGGVLLSWTGNVEGWVLESADRVPDGEWVTVNPAPEAGATQLRIDAGEAARFYRMRKP